MKSSIRTLLVLLLSVFGGAAAADDFKCSYIVKYKEKWPNCENIQCSTDKGVDVMEDLCSQHNDCTGFSFPTGQTSGTSCLKKCGATEFGGYGIGGDDYWVRVCTGCIYSIKYKEKWPNCENIQCSTDKSVDVMEDLCNQHSNCTGFSFPTGQTSGTSCLKKCGETEFGGYGIGSADYWVKGCTASSAEKSNETTAPQKVILTNKPTGSPTKHPTTTPTKDPTTSPIKVATASPTKSPTVSPSKTPFSLASSGAAAVDDSKCSYSIKYNKKWPNCENIQCSTDKSLADMEELCSQHTDCTGFSFPTGQTSGTSCLKKCGETEFGGYGIGSDDYWVKGCTASSAEKSNGGSSTDKPTETPPTNKPTNSLRNDLPRQVRLVAVFIIAAFIVLLFCTCVPRGGARRFTNNQDDVQPTYYGSITSTGEAHDYDE